MKSSVNIAVPLDLKIKIGDIEIDPRQISSIVFFQNSRHNGGAGQRVTVEAVRGCEIVATVEVEPESVNGCDSAR